MSTSVISGMGGVWEGGTDYGVDTLWDQRQCVNAAFLHSTKHILD
jgi:hypothetical protein